ncbi:MAG: cell division protein FtsZ [Candidatus Hydrogenedens sp.]
MTQRFTLLDSDDFGKEPDNKKVGKVSNPGSVVGFSGVMSGKEEFPGKKILIKVCGVGGGGGNAIERMIEQKMEEVDFIAINTDAQALSKSTAPIKIQIGVGITGGLGAGSLPDCGACAAEEDRETIREALEGAHMVFLTSGMGGGTGTGAAPIVAEIAKDLGALTVAVVTLPFEFEGPVRKRNAYEGIQRLREHVDALITIPNDRVSTLKDLTVKEAFLKVDEVLHNGIRAITDLIKIPQLINIDFADVRTILQNSGKAHLGIGLARGEKRPEEAVLRAIECNLLDTKSVVGAKGAILNIHGGSDMKMAEVLRAGDKLREMLGPDANVIFGAMISEGEREDICVTVIAAGFPEEQKSSEFIPSAITNITKEQQVTSSISSINKGDTLQIKEKKEEAIPKEEKKPEHGEELFSKEELKKANETPPKKDEKPTLDPKPPWLRQFFEKNSDR